MGIPTAKRPCFSCQRFLPSQADVQAELESHYRLKLRDPSAPNLPSELVFQLYGYCDAACEIAAYAEHLKRYGPDVEL